MSTAATVFLGVFGGGSLVTLITFLVNRYDNKKDKEEEKADKKDEILKEVKSVKKDVQDFKAEAEKRFDKMDRKVDDSVAMQARARFLRFDDEVQTGKKFSKSAWQQNMQDMTIYKSHCDKHKDFPNDIAEEAMSNTMRIYAELQARERNGEKVFL